MTGVPGVYFRDSSTSVMHFIFNLQRRTPLLLRTLCGVPMVSLVEGFHCTGFSVYRVGGRLLISPSPPIPFSLCVFTFVQPPDEALPAGRPTMALPPLLSRAQRHPRGRDGGEGSGVGEDELVRGVWGRRGLDGGRKWRGQESGVRERNLERG